MGPVPGGSKGAGWQVHFRRLRTWRIATIAPVTTERAQLNSAGVHDSLMQSYAVWRRSALLVAAPVLCLAAVLALFRFGEIETGEPFNELGVIAQVLPLLGPITLAAGAVLGLMRWSNLRGSSRVIAAGWVASIVLPLLPALMPLELLIDTDALVRQGGEGVLLELEFAKVSIGITYAIALLPVVVTFPGGVLRGGLRAKSLLGTSVVPGLFVVATAPFYSLVVLVAVIFVMQFAGNGLLMLGVVLLATAPWVYVVQRRHVMATAASPESNAALDKAQRTAAVLLTVGIALIALWALTFESNGFRVVASENALLEPMDAVRLLAEAVSRIIVTTVVFTNAFLMLALVAWRGGMQQRQADVAAAHDHAHHVTATSLEK